MCQIDHLKVVKLINGVNSNNNYVNATILTKRDDLYYYYYFITLTL